MLVALPGVARLRQDEAVHVRDPAKRVEPAEGLADGRRAQQDGDRVVVALLVELLNAKLEGMLRRFERAAGDCEPLLDRGALGADLRSLDSQRDHVCPCACELGVQRIQLEHGAVRTRGEPGVLSLQIGGVGAERCR